MKHVVYYDDTCPFCCRWKKRIMHLDKKHLFEFKALDKPSDTLILVESDGRRRYRSKAILRIFWLMGWMIPGCCYVLPAWLIDPIYCLIARCR